MERVEIKRTADRDEITIISSDPDPANVLMKISIDPGGGSRHPLSGGRGK